MPITLLTLFTTHSTILSLFMKGILDIGEQSVILLSPIRETFSPSECTRRPTKKPWRALHNTMNKLYTSLPDLEVCPLLRHEEESFEVGNNDSLKIGSSAYMKSSLWFGWWTRFSKLDIPTRQIRPDQQQNIRVVTSQFNVESSGGCLPRSAITRPARVSSVEKTETPFTISESRQPCAEVLTINIRWKRWDRIVGSHDRSSKRLWLGATVVPPTVCPALLYQGWEQCQ